MKENEKPSSLREADQETPSFLGEYWGFLKETKKWWLLPVLAILLIVGLLVVLSGSAAAPFIYTLF